MRACTCSGRVSALSYHHDPSSNPPPTQADAMHAAICCSVSGGHSGSSTLRWDSRLAGVAGTAVDVAPVRRRCRAPAGGAASDAANEAASAHAAAALAGSGTSDSDRNAPSSSCRQLQCFKPQSKLLPQAMPCMQPCTSSPPQQHTPLTSVNIHRHIQQDSPAARQARHWQSRQRAGSCTTRARAAARCPHDRRCHAAATLPAAPATGPAGTPAPTMAAKPPPRAPPALRSITQACIYTWALR